MLGCKNRIYIELAGHEMADTRPTQVNPWRAVYLCVLGIFAPAKLAAEEAADNAARNNYSEKADSTPRAFVVRCLLALHGGKHE